MRGIFFNRIGKVVLAIILLAMLLVLSSCSGDAAEVEVKLESVSGSTDIVVDNQKKTVEFAVDADSETFSLSRIRFSNHSEIVFKAYSDRECTKEIEKEVALLEGETVFYIKAWHKDARSEKSIYTVTITKPEAHVHAFGEWSVVTAPTCEDNGQKNRTCQGCGYSETEVIPAEGHAFVDKICQKCGTALNYTEGLSYKRKEKDSGYSVTGIASATDTDIVIPSQYNGLPVIDIDLWAFHNCSSLTSVEIPSSVTTIGAYAFDGCRGLKSVTFGENSQLTSIGRYAFRGCNGLTRVFIGDIEAWCSIDFYGTESNPLYYAHNLYLNGELVTELVIPDGVTCIGSSAFEGCSGLISVTFGENSQLASIGSSAFEGCSGLISVSFGENSQLTSIGSSAFYNCRGLTSIEIPSGVTSIGDNAFDGCDGLTIYCEATSKPSGWDTDWNKSNCTVVWDCNNNEVGTDGYAYVTIDTIRYAWKDGVATVARQPRSLSGDIEIPISIAYKGVVYPVTSIGEEAFYGCGSLTSIEIPASVTSVGDYAFWDCGGLTIYCEATSEPSGWSSLWEGQCPVVWDCNNNEVATDGYVYGIIDRIRYAWQDGVAIVARQPRSLSGDIVIPISIAYKGVVYPVTRIDAKAFYGCGSLTSIEIPASVTSIGDNAFYGCNGLTSVTLPFVGEGIDGTSNTHFGYIFGASTYKDQGNYVPDSLRTVVITGGTRIEGSAFYGCNGLTSITLPFIGESIDGTSNTHFGYIFGASTYKDQGDYVPDSLRTVMITGLTRGELPGSMTSVASNAFFNCSGLTRIELPNSVSYIGMSAFYNCNSLTSMEIPSGVTSIAPSAFYNCSRLTSITLPFIGESIDGTSNTHFGYIFGASSYDYNDDYVPKSLRTVMITGGTQIGNSAFYGCGGLTDIKLPRSVISIGMHAFYGCSGLTSVTFDDNSRLTSIGASAFEGCGGLVSVSFGNDSRLTSIGDRAFSGCGKLTNFEIPAHVMKIGSSAFSGCNKLIQTENGVGYVGRWVVDCDGTGATITLRDNTVGIAKAAFFGRSRLTSIAIPSGVTAIGASAFCGCSGLTSVTFGENSQLTSIGESAFSGCGGLTSIAIPNSVTSVGASAFEDCSGLKSVSIGDIATWCAIDFADAEANPLRYAHNLYLNGELVTELVIPNNVTSIGDYALEGCSGLASIEIPASVTSIGAGAFYNCGGLTRITFGANSQLTSIGKDAFYYCNGLTKIEIPSGVTRIGDGAFYYCSGLTSIAIPSGVTSIGAGAFYNCGGLTRITFGANSRLTSIGKDAFYYCSGLTSIEIPSEVAMIGENAFFGCSRMTSIAIPSSVTNIGASAFSYCSGLTSVYYGGISEQWANVAIGSVNSFLTNAMRYYYSETPPYDGGNYWHYVDGKPTKW
ncbi:MAG TPA: leucine-rich repeat protein [Candidatus Stercoripulliclostridium merdipullorum]|uniref:Leucine-rich repeat protein n=1 Tax=Candidatus Stercoripulliclostridium merdipullorum TaxID=2840952 RepID=A0A9D1SXY9_9FIRM|nr:leucine-rich repeat protein [Candidatus Stercoripulliclostridium merdipullorum]